MTFKIPVLYLTKEDWYLLVIKKQTNRTNLYQKFGEMNCMFVKKQEIFFHTKNI